LFSTDTPLSAMKERKNPQQYKSYLPCSVGLSFLAFYSTSHGRSLRMRLLHVTVL